MKYDNWFLFSLLAAAVLACVVACGSSGGSSQPTGDDASPADDDGSPGDDDGSPTDDDASPTDDDTQADPYAGFSPFGKKLDEILAINGQMDGTDFDTVHQFETDRLNEAGITMARTDFFWGDIEPQEGVWALDKYDTMVDVFTAAGIKVTAILDYGVSWAMPDGSPSEIDPTVWADFAGHVAAHFADRIDIYEIWNEENGAWTWPPEPDPLHYGEMLKTSYAAVHANDSAATVLLGGLMPAAGIEDFLQNGLFGFLSTMYAGHPDICNYFDALAIHPYTLAQFVSPEFVLDFLIGKYPDLVGVIQAARDRLAAMGCSDKPIYITELGWPDYHLGTDRQAAYAARSLLLALAAGVDYYYSYAFWDQEYGEGNTEATFGMFTWPHDKTSPKPSYKAWLGAHKTIGQSRYAGDLGARLHWPQEQLALALVDDAAVWTVALWHSKVILETQVPVSVPLPRKATGSWELYDQEGNLLSNGNAADGPAQVVLDGHLRYLRVAVGTQ